METFIYQIKKIIRQSILADFYILLKAPIDGDVTRFSKKQSITTESNQNFADYIFRNLITSTKNKTETNENILKIKTILSSK